MKINLGSGYKKYPNFVTIDDDINCKPDYVLNLETDDLPFEDSTIDYILAEHILEHIGSGYFRLLQEIYRVGKHGALVDIKVPHPNHEIYLNDPTHKRPITVEGLRLFSKEYNKLEIARGGSSSTLGLKYNVNFEIVDYRYIHDPFYDEIKQSLSQPQLERLFREALNTTLEIHILLMIVKDV